MICARLIGMIALAGGALGAAVGCGSDGKVGDGDADGSFGAGGDGGAVGVTLEFVTLGPDGMPSTGTDPLEFDEFAVDTITLQLHDLRLVGDTAPSGDLVFD